MPYHWEDREQMKASVRSAGLWGHACWFLGTIFAVLGIIGGAMNTALGLEPTYWLLLSIAAFVAGISFFIGVAMAWYLKTTETKKEE